MSRICFRTPSSRFAGAAEGRSEAPKGKAIGKRQIANRIFFMRVSVPSRGQVSWREALPSELPPCGVFLDIRAGGRSRPRSPLRLGNTAGLDPEKMSGLKY